MLMTPVNDMAPFAHLEVAALAGTIALATAAGLGMYFGIGGVLELVYYRRRREQAADWKCQPERFPSPNARRRELVLGTANMTLGSLASGVFVYYALHGGDTGLYVSLAEHGVAYSIASTLAYLLATDLALYWLHRGLHTPRLYRAIHRVHHRWGAPTAFTAAAMHPLEFALYQSVMLVPLLFVPLHAAGVIAVLVATHYYALIDHSGVRLRSWWPFIAPTRFHDDHHAHFHVNFGQSFLLWDRVFGTLREPEA